MFILLFTLIEINTYAQAAIHIIFTNNVLKKDYF